MEIGERFGKQEIIKILDKSNVEVRCDCGTIKIKRYYDLKTGATHQCLNCRYGKKIIRKQRSSAISIKTGMKFSSWTIVDENDFKIECETKERSYRVRCDCGTESYVRVSFLTSERSKGCSLCKSKRTVRLHDKDTFVGDIPKTILTAICHKAKDRGLKMELTHEDLWKLFCKQMGECAITGISLSFGESYSDRKGRTASLDRIDSSKGYVKGNVQWVHKEINRMKGNLSQESFIDLCKAVYEFSLFESKSQRSKVIEIKDIIKEKR